MAVPVLRRWLVASSLVTFVGCGPAPASPAPVDQSAGSTGVGHVPGDVAPLIDPIALVGTWSFDRSCASSDGMRLAADGTMDYDETAHGWWAIDADQRLVMILREQEPGLDADPLAERRVMIFTPTARVGDDLVGAFAPSRPDDAPRAVNAKRCPGVP